MQSTVTKTKTISKTKLMVAVLFLAAAASIAASAGFMLRKQEQKPSFLKQSFPKRESVRSIPGFGKFEIPLVKKTTIKTPPLTTPQPHPSPTPRPPSFSNIEYTNTFGDTSFASDVDHDKTTGYVVAVGVDVTTDIVGGGSRRNGEWRIEKYNPVDGSVSWSIADNPSPYPDKASGVAIDSLGQIIVVGDRDGEWRVTKRTPDGVLLWEMNDDIPGFDEATKVAIDSENNIIVVGVHTPRAPDGSSSGDAQWRIHKYSPDGLPLWSTASDPSTSTDIAYDVAVDADSNIIVVGQSSVLVEAPPGSIVSWVRNEVWRIEKYSPSGVLLWSVNRDHAPNDADRALGVAIIKRDHLVVAGYYHGSSGQAFWTVEQFDGDGVFRWNNTSTFEGVPYSVATDDFDNTYISGWSVPSDSVAWGDSEWRIQKYNFSGEILQTWTSNPTRTDCGMDSIAYGVTALPRILPKYIVAVGWDGPTDCAQRWRVEINRTEYAE